MQLNPLMKKKSNVTRKNINIPEDVYDLLLDMTRPASLSVNSSKEEFVANLVKSQLRERLASVKEKGYVMVRV